MKREICTVVALAVVLGSSAARELNAQDPIVAHEWGTITTRHAPDGTPLGRLNRIDSSDALPPFVHRYEPAQTANDPEKSLVKTPLVPGRPDVTMRLETPVIYFYPTREGTQRTFDVSVRFRGGVINEFYPDAQASVAVDVERAQMKMNAGLLPPTWDGEVLDNYVVGRLLWRGIHLAERASLPSTSSHVWLSPRSVHATDVISQAGEGERYLFYRGVAHLDALVQTQLETTELRLLAPRRLEWMHRPSMTIAKLWLVDIRPDGSSAFREHGPLTIEKAAPSKVLTRFPLLSPSEYSLTNANVLRQVIKRALVDAGLFEPEADAMLETWKHSYFQSPGLKLLYLVPDEWLGYFLPLNVSVPHQLTRVIVGRIDLVRR